MIGTTKIANTTQVLQANAMASCHTIAPELAEQLDPDGVHIVVTHMLHNDDSIRCRFWLKVKDKEEPEEGIIDVPIRMFNKLTSVE